jgi:FkbM family methyltransferase
MIIKKKIKKLIKFLSFFFTNFLKRFGAGRYFLEQLNKSINNLNINIRHKDVSLNFFTPNRLNLFRAKTFSEKEPETLAWIDNFKNDSIFWDIGANVGVYSCYAAKKKKTKVYAFESSVFNLECLVKNININNLNKVITIFPLPLTDNLKETDFNLSSIDSGSAMASFGVNYKSDGSDLNKIFNYKILGLSIDDAIKDLKLKTPNYIKIDVDGIEHLILSGGMKALSEVDEILVEVDEKFETQVEKVKSILSASGLKLSGKYQSLMMQKTNKKNRTFNQIWKRNI